MASPFQLLMISAMYENGGNTTHRFLDGHPGMYVYPFESQVGTKYIADHLSSMYPLKYRWPVFDMAATPHQDFMAIIDEECRVRARTPNVSKFRHMPFELSDIERGECYVEHIQTLGRSRANNIEAFFRATFEAWKDYDRTGDEAVHVGYCPIIVVDAEKILQDYPNSHILHVVRNPWSAYADTKKRPVPLNLHHYMLGWTMNQYYALHYQRLYPERVHIVRVEDVMADSYGTLGKICDAVGLAPADSLRLPTWNSRVLEEVYPWGTLRKVTPEVNKATARELSEAERGAIHDYTYQYLDVFDYQNILQA